jgi:hypothetical protein
VFPSNRLHFHFLIQKRKQTVEPRELQRERKTSFSRVELKTMNGIGFEALWVQVGSFMLYVRNAKSKKLFLLSNPKP